MSRLSSEILATLRICCTTGGRKFAEADLEGDTCILCRADTETANRLRCQLFTFYFEPLPDETCPLSWCSSPSCLNPHHMAHSVDMDHYPWVLIQWDDSDVRDVYWLTPTYPDPLRVET